MAANKSLPGELATPSAPWSSNSPHDRQQAAETASAGERLRRVAQYVADTLAQTQPSQDTLPN